MAKLGAQAVVLGASMAGLLAARVLAEHFDRVVLVDRDRLPDGPAPRKGVPQGTHVHGLWPRGLRFMERKLPGLHEALLAGGAAPVDAGRNFKWHQFGALKSREPVGITTILCSRPFLEHHVRSRVLALPNVALIEAASVRGLLARADRGRVTGVSIQRDGAPAEEALAADYVVDATGRAGHAGRWLESLGYGRAPESTVRIDLTYVTRLYERSGPVETAANVLVATPPEGRRGGVAFAIEGDRWIVTLAGFVGEVPPNDEAARREYARSLPAADIHDIVTASRPLGEPAVFKFPSNLRRHYERCRRFPEGFLVIGDALTSFNPAYGQGMTVAALEAEALETCLAREGSTDGLARRFFKAVKPIVDVPWMITTGEDMRFPQAAGKRPPLHATINAYFTRVHHAAAVDPVVCKAFLGVAAFEAAPPAMFAPRIVWRVLRGARRFRDLAMREQPDRPQQARPVFTLQTRRTRSSQ